MAVKWRGKRKCGKPSAKGNGVRVAELIGLIFVGMWTVAEHFSLIPRIFVKEKSAPKEQVGNRRELIQRLLPKAKMLNQVYHVRASVSLAQAILESNDGQSLLAKKYGNLFGVKELGEGPAVELDTKEFVDGHWIEIKGKFRIYSSFEDSMEDHAKLLANGVDWNSELYQGVLAAKNYQEAAVALQQAGYATDPSYAQKLIQLIEENQLAQYDE